MIMSLLVPVITNKLRHSPAHLVEKNAWNDVRHEASKVTTVHWRPVMFLWFTFEIIEKELETSNDKAINHILYIFL